MRDRERQQFRNPNQARRAVFDFIEGSYKPGAPALGAGLRAAGGGIGQAPSSKLDPDERILDPGSRRMSEAQGEAAIPGGRGHR